MNERFKKQSPTFLSKQSRSFLLENNYNLLLLLEEEQHKEPITSINSDDEPVYDADKKDEAGTEQEEETAETEPVPPQSPEEMEDFLNQNLNLADQKFIQFRLYDKIVLLMNMLSTLKSSSNLTMDELEIINNFHDYSIILNELIFVMDVNAVYQLIGQIEIDLESFLQTVEARLKTNLDNYNNKLNESKKD
jgi:hypothetical protein